MKTIATTFGDLLGKLDVLRVTYAKCDRLTQHYAWCEIVELYRLNVPVHMA